MPKKKTVKVITGEPGQGMSYSCINLIDTLTLQDLVRFGLYEPDPNRPFFYRLTEKARAKGVNENTEENG